MTGAVGAGVRALLRPPVRNAARAAVHESVHARVGQPGRVRVAGSLAARDPRPGSSRLWRRFRHHFRPRCWPQPGIRLWDRRTWLITPV